MKKLYLFGFCFGFLFTTNAQLFKQGRYAFKLAVDSWNEEKFNDFMHKYPNSKFIPEIQKRSYCLERNSLFFKATNSTDTLLHLNYLNRYNSCSQCNDYLPNSALSGLTKDGNDISIIKDSLDHLRANQMWSYIIKKTAPTDFAIIQYFKNRFPNIYYSKIVIDTLYARKDLFYWLSANDASGFKTYCDSMPNGKFISQAKASYEEYTLWESCQFLTNLNDLISIQEKLKALNPKSKFIANIYKKIKEEEENVAFIKLKSSSNLLNWLDFETSFTNGKHKKEVDKKIRKLAAIPAADDRSPFGTFVRLNSIDETEITFVSNKNVKTKVKLNKDQWACIFIDNGKYTVESKNSTSQSLILSGKPILCIQMFGNIYIR